MKFTRYTFLIAGIYGLLVLVPQYFLEERIGLDSPPAITHPEFFYGFVGVAAAFQIVFLIIAKDPLKYRLMIIPSILEKFSFGIAVIVLFIKERIPVTMFGAGTIDLILGVLFVVCLIKLSRSEPAKSANEFTK